MAQNTESRQHIVWFDMDQYGSTGSIDITVALADLKKKHLLLERSESLFSQITSITSKLSYSLNSKVKCYQLTFPIENVKLRQTITQVACSFWTRNSRSNYNAFKIFKSKPLCDIFFRVKWALNDFGRNFQQVSEIYSRTLWFLSF